VGHLYEFDFIPDIYGLDRMSVVKPGLDWIGSRKMNPCKTLVCGQPDEIRCGVTCKALRAESPTVLESDADALEVFVTTYTGKCYKTSRHAAFINYCNGPVAYLR